MVSKRYGKYNLPLDWEDVMNLMQAIKNNDVYTVEEILKKELEHRPEDIQLWFKLSLTELQYPFEDYESALNCIDEISKLATNNLDALILETGIKWHSFGFIEDELFERLSKAKSDNSKKQAIIYYLLSLFFQFRKDIKNQKIYLEKSIVQCNEFVYPYETLGQLLLSESKIDESKKMFNSALSNIKKIYHVDDFYDFTDLEVYIEEFITGTAISEENYKHIKELALN